MPLPIAAALGIGAAAGGIAGLFGNKHRRKKYNLSDLTGYGYTPINESEEIGNINRITDANLARRRANEGQKAAKYGFEPLVPNYARESDIYDAQIQGVNDVKARAREDKNRIAQLLLELNAGGEDDQSDLSAFLEGAVPGAAYGAETYNVLNPPKFHY